MKTLYFECGMGAAGDMLMSSLLQLHDNPDDFLSRLNNAGIPQVKVEKHQVHSYGITGMQVSVQINGVEEASEDVHEHERHHDYENAHPHTHHHHPHHDHASMHTIEQLIGGLRVSSQVKQNALSVYKVIAAAESCAHGVPVGQVHFHEVGAMDAIADIVGVCLLIEGIAPEQIIASPIHVGSGHVRCAHGVLPVPAPATAHILQGIPIYGGRIEGELCTPTGAALLKHFATKFESMPTMKVEGIGYGVGKKDFGVLSCVRSFLGESENATEEVIELMCNLDDMTPEAVAFAQQTLLEAGALDVYTIPIGMKKGRCGILLSCMCRDHQREKFTALIFKHTTTIGIREIISKRHVLSRESHTRHTPYGSVNVKASSGFGVSKHKAEYDDLSQIAHDKDISLAEARLIAEAASNN